jgi:hypothetical protein
VNDVDKLRAAANKLNDISQEAKQLFEVLQPLAHAGRDADDDQRTSILTLAESLDTETRAACTSRLEVELDQLNTVIDAHTKTLAVPNLPQSVSDAVRADLIAKRGRRVRLNAVLGTDFDGMLTQTEVEQLSELVTLVKRETQTKKLAAEFLGAVMKISDIAFRVAAKLAA